MTIKIHENVLINNQFLEAEVELNELIRSIKILGPYNPSLSYLIPGFIDLHVHGAGGADIMECHLAIKTVAKTCAQFGTTSFLATTMTSEFQNIKNTFEDINNYLETQKTQKSQNTKEAKVLGIHLEGPYINPLKLGAQLNKTSPFSVEEIKTLQKIVPIKIITLAPEIFNHLEIIPLLKKMNIIVQLGHSNATYEEAVLALDQGAKSFTHLYNAMATFHHRSPGIVGAALAHAEFAEIIPDLLHVHPGAIKMALRSIPNLYFVSDSTAATGMPDGEYKLGEQAVHKCLGGVRLKDGTLAGSTLTMNQALLNLIQIGLTLPEISRRFSAIPAELIGINNRGLIKKDYYADLLVLDKKFNLNDIYLEGKKL